MQSPEHYQKLLDQARALKDAGNQNYLEKNYRSAIRSYHDCLLHARVVQQLPETSNLLSTVRPPISNETEQDDGNNESESYSDARTLSREEQEKMRIEADEIVLKCYNNLAASILNGPGRDSDAYMRAADYCDKVIAKEPGNQKALFRRGQALFKAGMLEKAIDAFVKCPNSKEARNYQNLCKQAIDADRKRRGEEIRRNFEIARQKEAAREQGMHLSFILFRRCLSFFYNNHFC